MLKDKCFLSFFMFRYKGIIAWHRSGMEEDAPGRYDESSPVLAENIYTYIKLLTQLMIALDCFN